MNDAAFFIYRNCRLLPLKLKLWRLKAKRRALRVLDFVKHPTDYLLLWWKVALWFCQVVRGVFRTARRDGLLSFLLFHPESIIESAVTHMRERWAEHRGRWSETTAEQSLKAKQRRKRERAVEHRKEKGVYTQDRCQ